MEHSRTGLQEIWTLFAGVNPVLELSESVSELILFPLQKQFTSYAGVQIVDICLATRPHNGGLLDLEELRGLLAKRRWASREPITEDDCLRAVSKLKVDSLWLLI